MVASPSTVVAVFARNPEPGRVKTRLAAAIGNAAAADLYAAFVRDLRTGLPDPRWELRWWIAPPSAGFSARFEIDPGRCREQRGADLGERMRFALEETIREGCARCAIVGSDMPQLSPSRLAIAFAALERADVVLGPARDGGYYLIAMREPHDLFGGVAWSTASVLEATRVRAVDLGLVVELLPLDFDVDDERDLGRLRELLADPAAARRLRHTKEALQRIDARGAQP